jgi:hypothetical protein
MDIGSHTAAIHRLISPGPLDLIAIVFKQDKRSAQGLCNKPRQTGQIRNNTFQTLRVS